MKDNKSRTSQSFARDVARRTNMDNSFVDQKQAFEVDPVGDLVVRRTSDKDRKQKRDALYEQFTPLVFAVLDQMIAAYRPGIWKMESDYNHRFCCHCRWFAGPEETGRAHYDDHAIRRRIEIELEIDGQCHPIGFKIQNHANPGERVQVDLSQDELVRGIKAVL
jgi:hypothetical protein